MPATGIKFSCCLLGECKKLEYVKDVHPTYRRMGLWDFTEDEDILQKQIDDIRISDCTEIILLGTEMALQDLTPFQKLG